MDAAATMMQTHHYGPNGAGAGGMTTTTASSTDGNSLHALVPESEDDLSSHDVDAAALLSNHNESLLNGTTNSSHVSKEAKDAGSDDWGKASLSSEFIALGNNKPSNPPEQAPIPPIASAPAPTSSRALVPMPEQAPQASSTVNSPAPEQSQELVPYSATTASQPPASVDNDDIIISPASTADGATTTAIVPAVTISNLNLRNEPGMVQLYDREREMSILRDEFATMVKRARLHNNATKKDHHNNTNNDDSENEDELLLPQSAKKLNSVLCIAGKSGTGKTALAHSLASGDEQVAKTGGYIVFGKCDWPTTSVTSTTQALPFNGDIATSFDRTQNKPALQLAFDESEQTKQHEPFAAYASMLDYLVIQIEAKGPVAADKIRVRIRQAIGVSGISVIASLSPKLGSFLRVVWQSRDPASPDEGPPTFVTTSKEEENVPKKDNIRVDLRLARMKYTMREFFKALTSDGCPCVMILDDAQWADQESLELARHLHADPENPLFMLILTWRTNDIHEEESCYTAVGSSIGIFSDDLVRRINLQNLSQDGITLLVAEALQMPSSQVTKLAKVVFSKAFGNPFHTKQYIAWLEQEYQLRWSAARSLWRWDENKIEMHDTSYTAGELVKDRLRKLPQKSLTVLKIVSNLGQSFDEIGACTIIGKMDTKELFDVDVNSGETAQCLEALVQGGFLERRVALQRTVFAHDQLQESVYQLIPKGSRSLLQLRIGERLLEVMEEHSSDNVSFLGVDLCSKGISFLSSKERMGLALYNLLAGEKCIARSSFATALAYFEYGLSSLRVNDFLKGRLSLELSFGAMEAAFCVDDFDSVRLHYDRITGSGSNSDDKIRAHILLIQSTGSRGDPKEAIETGFRVLKSMGVKTILEIANKVSVYVQLTKTKMALRKHTEDSLTNLREMNGVQLRQAMRIIEAMLPFAYIHDRQLFMHLVMKSVRWSIKYGMSGQSALVFAALGSFPAFQAMDMSLATICGQTALRLMERFGSRDYPGMVMFLVHSQILNWTTDLPEVQKHLDRTYKVSMESGDVLSAYCSLGASYAISYESCAKNLEELEVLGEVYSRRIRDNGSESIAAIHDTTWQAVLNLRGESFDATELSGQAIKNQDEAILLARTSGNDLLEFMVLSRQVQLSYLMGQHQRGDAFRARSDNTVRSMASSPHLVSHVAYCALNCLALCASNSPASKRNSSHYKTATRLFKKLHHWRDDQGYKYCSHMIDLVQAEFYRVGGDFNSAQRSCEQAIEDAEAQGNLREKGLAHELLGRLLMRDQQDEMSAAQHIDEAMQAYHAWGAVALVNRLLDSYGDILPENPEASELVSSFVSTKSNEPNVV